MQSKVGLKSFIITHIFLHQYAKARRTGISAIRDHKLQSSAYGPSLHKMPQSGSGSTRNHLGFWSPFLTILTTIFDQNASRCQHSLQIRWLPSVILFLAPSRRVPGSHLWAGNGGHIISKDIFKIFLFWHARASWPILSVRNVTIEKHQHISFQGSPL